MDEFGDDGHETDGTDDGYFLDPPPGPPTGTYPVPPEFEEAIGEFFVDWDKILEQQECFTDPCTRRNNDTDNGDIHVRNLPKWAGPQVDVIVGQFWRKIEK